MAQAARGLPLCGCAGGTTHTRVPRSGAVARGSSVEHSPALAGKSGKRGGGAPPHTLKTAEGLAVQVAALINEAGPVITVRYENGSVQHFLSQR